MIKIERKHPAPTGRLALTGKLSELREAIAQMKPRESFEWTENRHPYVAADQVGATITTRKLLTGGYRIWRVS